ncbi:MAG TPA: GT4 family glycosyltransferase PelF [Paenibacillus sp.]|uniref:GT4 family glycosyltransferase PelF n=1 Tax=Paenibacillus sp. TaxID=58172 RepID=UPI002C2A9795|nr:GT4 family glycosyltransferase PelF [Paenibacillus sp.]HUC91831.1 GT4 family glycosyltransferase PelF [Paenibacillus sp.]
MNDKIKVMLATEGTYPFHQGGVSTWCDILIQKLRSVDYVIFSVLMNPFVTQKFKLPEQDALIKMPLWGTEEPAEHLETPFSHIYKLKKNTHHADIAKRFIPLFRDLILEILAQNKNPVHFADILLQMHEYFKYFEYKVTFKSELTWNVFKELILKAAADKDNRIVEPDIYGLNQSLGWIYRFLNILNTPLPEAHVTHSSAAAFCGIPCVLSKLANNTPYLLTEHGVYLREQYLSLSRNGYSSYLSTFLIRFVLSITSMNYAFADQVSPVCQYNMRWETRFGVHPSNVKVIYNGVDEKVFVEASGTAPRTSPTVVMVARIDPIKDIMSFMRAAALVKEHIPEAKFVVYGSVSVPEYYEQCLAVKEELQLEHSFIFAGHTSNTSAAYQSGDVIALSSISEAFPYSVVEAMMTGKPVIATDVGGVKEALSDTGILVQPRNERDMADGILKLLRNRQLADELGREGRQRALSLFTLDRVLDLHLKSYITLAVRAEERLPAAAANKSEPASSVLAEQKLYMERGYALIMGGYDQKAIVQFQKALWLQPNSVHAPVLLTEIAQAFNRIGEYDRAFQELYKYEAYVTVVTNGAIERSA